jgi:hypothetical protein
MNASQHRHRIDRPSHTAPRRRALACVLLLSAATSCSWAAEDADLAAFQQRQTTLRTLGDQSQSVKSITLMILRAGFEQVRDCSADSDGDGLSDCSETGDGQFISAASTGTDPMNPDSDGDGLGDGEEILGAETGLDLPALGVHPLRRDLLVEIDWFDSDYDCGPHSQRPAAASIERLVAMFAASPTPNADGSTGIRVIVDYGQGGLFTGGNRIEGHDAILPGFIDATFHEIKQANFDPARLGYFRYVMMPHRYDNGSMSSGAAEVVGDDAIVSLYCANTESNVARTLAHELGHLLGLHHGGFENCNRKPNYNSLMNYRFQFAGTDADCDAFGDPATEDFSRGTRALLDENALDETQGVCGSETIDWNANGAIESALALDLNPDAEASCGGALVPLHDFDDWSNLTFIGLEDRNGTLKSVQQHAQCAGAPVTP